MSPAASLMRRCPAGPASPVRRRHIFPAPQEERGRKIRAQLPPLRARHQPDRIVDMGAEIHPRLVSVEQRRIDEGGQGRAEKNRRVFSAANTTRRIRALGRNVRAVVGFLYLPD